MSGKAMGWALEQSTELPVDKLILIAIGNFSDDQHQCFPSRRKLAELAMCSLDTVDRSIKRLMESGLLSKDTRLSPKGGLSSNVYSLPVGDYASGNPKQLGEASRNMRPPHDDNPSRNLRGGGGRNLPPTLAAPDAATLAAIVRPQEPTTEPSIEGKTPLPPLQGGGPDPVKLYELISANSPKPAANSPDPIAVQAAFEAYNARALILGLPQASRLTPDRRRRIGARLREWGSDGWSRALTNLDSPFLRGRNDRGFRADLDFVCQPKSFARLHDGGYARTGASHEADCQQSQAGHGSRLQRAADAIRRSNAAFGLPS